MRCNASPPAPAAVDAVRGTLEAVLFREILKPLANALGPVGDVALGPLAETLARTPKR